LPGSESLLQKTLSGCHFIRCCCCHFLCGKSIRNVCVFPTFLRDTQQK
jgi:hypothetical protein